MRNVWTIGAKEYVSYLSSPMAYIITAAFLIGTGFFFSFSQTAFTETSIRGILGNTMYTIVVLLLMALLTMRLIAEEKKLGTIELRRAQVGAVGHLRIHLPPVRGPAVARLAVGLLPVDALPRRDVFRRRRAVLRADGQNGAHQQRADDQPEDAHGPILA